MRVHRGSAFFLSLLIASAFAVLVRAQQAAPDAGPAKPALLGQYDDWGVYAATPNGRKICFAIAKPISAETKPPNHARNQPYMSLATRPADKVINEISIVVDYPFRMTSEATIQVGSTTFQLYTQGDTSWVKNIAEETHIVDALSVGGIAVVKGTSADGMESIDTYSLKGLTEALDRVAQECKPNMTRQRCFKSDRDCRLEAREPNLPQALLP